MAELIIMPKLGFNMDEGTLVKWYKSIGDDVSKGEALFSIETDKTVIDIESTANGILLRTYINENETIAVTLPIGIIGNANEDIDEIEKKALDQLDGKEDKVSIQETENEEKISSAPSIPTKKEESILKLTPRARKYAVDNQIDTNSLDIQGSGFENGITESDLIAYSVDHSTKNKTKITPLAKNIMNIENVEIDDIKGSGANGKITKNDILANRSKEKESSSSEKEILTTIPYKGVRKIIGERLAESKFTAPHVYFTQEVILDELQQLRKKVNETQSKKTSVTDFILKAVVKTLIKYPDVNTSLIDGNIETYKSVNIGMAVAAPGGLIVPNVKSAEQKSLIEISEKATELITKAREGKLTIDEYTGGTFTVSNLGMFGIENFTAIINPPEAAILAVSAVKDKPVVVTDINGQKNIEIKSIMNITLTVDHRLIDGLLAAEFVTEVKRVLENPLEIII